jgi:filamentous hemagglutinin family protein
MKDQMKQMKFKIKPIYLAIALLYVGVAEVGAQTIPTLPSNISGATVANTANSVTVTQTASKAVINWDTFSLSSGATFNVTNQTVNSILLNRVVGGSASQINGSITANGSVWIVNPQGVYFNSGSSVSVGSLLASTLAITDASFNAGTYQFTPSGTSGSIRLDGTINASGYVLALSPNISQASSGAITVPQGQVQLIANDNAQIAIGNTGLITASLGASATQSIINTEGAITVDNGSVLLSALGNSLVAKSLLTQSGTIQSGSGASSGNITLETSGDVTVAGTLKTSGTNSTINLSSTSGNVSVPGTISAINAGSGVTISAPSGSIPGASSGSISVSAPDKLITSVNFSAPQGSLTANGAELAANGDGTYDLSVASGFTKESKKNLRSSTEDRKSIEEPKNSEKLITDSTSSEFDITSNANVNTVEGTGKGAGGPGDGAGPGNGAGQGIGGGSSSTVPSGSTSGGTTPSGSSSTVPSGSTSGGTTPSGSSSTVPGGSTSGGTTPSGSSSTVPGGSTSGGTTPSGSSSTVPGGSTSGGTTPGGTTPSGSSSTVPGGSTSGGTTPSGSSSTVPGGSTSGGTTPGGSSSTVPGGSTSGGTTPSGSSSTVPGGSTSGGTTPGGSSSVTPSGVASGSASSSSSSTLPNGSAGVATAVTNPAFPQGGALNSAAAPKATFALYDATSGKARWVSNLKAQIVDQDVILNTSRSRTIPASVMVPKDQPTVTFKVSQGSLPDAIFKARAQGNGIVISPENNQGTAMIQTGGKTVAAEAMEALNKGLNLDLGNVRAITVVAPGQ